MEIRKVLNEVEMEGVGEHQVELAFDMGRDARSISIAFNNNIFIKEDNNRPVQMISYVGRIALIVRGFFAFFMVIVITVFFLEYYNSQLVL